MKNALLASTFVLALAQAASAQDGLYYGVGLGLSFGSTTSPVVNFYEAKGTDYALALTAGYRFAGTGALTFGVEGNLDLQSGTVLDDSGIDACTGASPTWCEIDTTLRVRGTMATDLNGSRWTTSLGAVVVQGRSENGGGNYLSTTGRGVSVGVAWEKLDGGMPVRLELNYDTIRSDDQTAFDRSLDLVGLRVSYMF